MTGRPMTDKIYRATLILMIALAAGLSAFALFVKLNAPIIDAFGFRQTQTAISIFYMMKGSPIFAYETPVLGAPWAIPFEFPTYHVIVAVFARMFGHLDATGRIVSYIFFLLCLYPIARIYRLHNAPRHALTITAILALASPLYVLYSRAFLIETTALFFALTWLWLFCEEMKDHRRGVTAFGVGIGALAMLTKPTTFLPVVIFAFVLMVPPVVQNLRQSAYRAAIMRLLLAAVLTLPAIAIGYLWVRWTDDIRILNPFADVLTSAKLRNWNFGYPGQRTSADFWAVVTGRIPVEIFGYASLGALLPIGAGLAFKRTQLLTIAAAVTFFGALLLFPNLHFIHNYYQTSVAIFAIMACALGICALYELNSKPLAFAALIGLGGSQLAYSYKTTLGTIRADHTFDQTYQIGRMATKITTPNDALIVFGSDWSSEIPYYAERKSIGVPGWASDAQLAALARAPLDFLGGLKLGGVIVCDPVGRPALQKAANQLIAGLSLKGQAAACKLYAPN